MKKKSNVLALICAVICALCIFAFMFSMVQENNAARAEALAKYGGEQLEVCVANRDIAVGETVYEGDFEKKLWLAELLPTDAVTNSKDIVGKEVSSSIIKGEVISSKRFMQNKLALEVPDGMVAISLSAKDVQTVGGSIQKGMYVDIYATGNSGTSLIANNSQVLATSSAEGNTSSDAKMTWVTVAVKPEQVQELVSAEQTTNIYFTLPGEKVKEDQDKTSKQENKDSTSSNSSSTESSKNSSLNSNANKSNENQSQDSQ